MSLSVTGHKLTQGRPRHVADDTEGFVTSFPFFFSHIPPGSRKAACYPEGEAAGERQTNRVLHRQNDREPADRQIDKRTYRQADTQTEDQPTGRRAVTPDSRRATPVNDRPTKCPRFFFPATANRNGRRGRAGTGEKGRIREADCLLSE